MKVFIDTGVLIASVLPRDAHHEDGQRLVERIADGEWSSALTSDYVVAEALNFVQMKVGRREAAEGILNAVFGSGNEPPVVTHVIRINSTRFAAALERYRRRFDAGLSFTDWTTVVAMADERIEQIATFDRGFRGVVDVVEL